MINPIIPIWLMSIICVALLILKRRGIFPFIRQIIMVILLFVLNLRIMIPSDKIETEVMDMDAYVLFVVDDTISMIAEDYDGENPRLDAVKADCEYIIDELYGARFGVISFNNTSHINSPYTNDSNYATSVIKAIYPLDQYYAKGTSMNICLEDAEKMLETASKKNDGNAKVIMFFISDGEINNDEELESFRSLSKYVDGGAVLGYGTEDGGQMHLQSLYESEPVLITSNSFPYDAAVSKIDESNLKQIAKDIGVDYVHMTEQSDVDDVIDDILDNVMVESENGETVGYEDIYFYFAGALAVMLLIEFVCYKRREY